MEFNSRSFFLPKEIIADKPDNVRFYKDIANRITLVVNISGKLNNCSYKQGDIILRGEDELFVILGSVYVRGHISMDATTVAYDYFTGRFRYFYHGIIGGKKIGSIRL